MSGTSLAFLQKHANVACPYQLGDKVTFRPSAFSAEWNSDTFVLPSLTGRVVYINEARRYYTVEAQCHGRTLRESFKF